jgi:hypothetical protein
VLAFFVLPLALSAIVPASADELKGRGDLIGSTTSSARRSAAGYALQGRGSSRKKRMQVESGNEICLNITFAGGFAAGTMCR